MAATLNIPLTSLPPGNYRFPASGGQAVADTDSAITLTIDRTVAGGLNAVTSAVTIAIQAYQADASGTRQLGGATGVGGTIQMDRGGVETTFGYEQGLFPGTGRQVYAQVQVAGGTVAVQGTVASS